MYTEPTSPFTEPSLGVTTPTLEGSKAGLNTCGAKHSGIEPPSNTETFTELTAENTATLCTELFNLNSKLSGRLFWVTEEALRTREAVESLKTELVKALGSEGTIAKDLTASGGLKVKAEGTTAVSLASLPELATGTHSVGSVKVSELQGEPAIKALQDGTWKSVGAALEGTSPVKCTEGCSGGGGSGEVKVSNEPDKPQLEVVQADETAAKDVAETAGENDREALWFLGGLVVALVIGFAIYRQGSIRG